MSDRPLPFALLVPEDAPFSPLQRAWLNGFFTALLQQPPPASAAATAQRTVTVLFASQTGTAESLAKKLAKEAKGKGYAAAAKDLGSVPLEDLAKLGEIFVIASTHGEGEPPDTVLTFVDRLAQAEGSLLSGLKFAVLALGDSNYASFCKFGNDLDRRLAELGGERILDRIDCDGDTDEPFAQWRGQLFAKLAATASAVQAPSSISVTPADEEESEDEARWTRKHPFRSKLLANISLNSRGSDKDCRHIVLSLADSGLLYQPGDALGVWAPNAGFMVDAVLRASGNSGKEQIKLPSGEQMPLDEALTHKLAIGKLAIPTLIKFAKRANAAELNSLLQPEKSEDLEAFLWGREFIDLLENYPGVVTSASDLVAMLPLLAPRLYSISSSQSAHPEEVHLTVSAVRFRTHDRKRAGIASTFLADYAKADTAVPIYLQPNRRFRLPEDQQIPVIMVGPGTGVAPFRAFLEERRARASKGRSWLFFGDRRADCDFLYRDEIQGFVNDKTLTNLDLAFSRDGPDKVYVQHRMQTAGAELWNWIRDGAHIYVCGDGSRMAKDVDTALRTIFCEHGRMSEAQAKLELGSLASNGRYARDVY